MRSTIAIAIVAGAALAAAAPVRCQSRTSAPRTLAVAHDAPPPQKFQSSLSVGVAIPLTGSPNLVWARPVSDRILLGSEFAYFDRSWVMILEESDWHSRSGYLGTSLQYYPGVPGRYEGYWVGIDGGLAISHQTYRPTSESGTFFFPYVDFYFLGYTFGGSHRILVDLWVGGGWAPVGSEVRIGEHAHDTGDFYPIADVRLTYRW
jgi:hypothetical protein